MRVAGSPQWWPLAKSAPKRSAGCPRFAPAYLGRKGWAKPNDRFRSFDSQQKLCPYQQKLCPYQEARGAPHLARFSRDAPNFLHATLNKTACAPFFKERRMRFAEPTKLHRKSGMWDTTALNRKPVGFGPCLVNRCNLWSVGYLPHQSTPAPATYTDQTCRSSQRPQPSLRTIFCRKP